MDTTSDESAIIPKCGKTKPIHISSPRGRGTDEDSNAIGREHEFQFIHDACLCLGWEPLVMAPPAVLGLPDEEPELAVDPPGGEVPSATDAAAMDSHAEQRDGAEDPQNVDDDLSDAADQEPGGAKKCAYCRTGFLSGEQHQMIDGLLYHSHLCAKLAKLIAITA